MFGLLTEIAKQGGIIGLVIALMGGGFAFVVWVLWKQHLSTAKRLQDERDALQAKLDAINEKRMADALEVRAILIDNFTRVAHGIERMSLLMDWQKNDRRG